MRLSQIENMLLPMSMVEHGISDSMEREQRKTKIDCLSNGRNDEDMPNDFLTALQCGEDHHAKHLQIHARTGSLCSYGIRFTADHFTSREVLVGSIGRATLWPVIVSLRAGILKAVRSCVFRGKFGLEPRRGSATNVLLDSSARADRA